MAANPDRVLLDTSVVIANESGRTLSQLPQAGAVSVVTLAELYLGVLMAQSSERRAQRLKTLTSVQAAFEPLMVDLEVARAFAELTADAKRAARRLPIMDAWIAATAIAHDLTLCTQDADFLPIGRLRVVRV